MLANRNVKSESFKSSENIQRKEDRPDRTVSDNKFLLVTHYKLSLVMRNKRCFAYAKTKAQISCTVTAQLVSAFVFATRIVQSLCFLNPKFQVSSHLLWLYSLVCVGPRRKPRRPVFSQRGSIDNGSQRKHTVISRFIKAAGPRPGSEVKKLFSCSTQLSIKFELLINIEIATSKEIFRCESLKPVIYPAN